MINNFYKTLSGNIKQHKKKFIKSFVINNEFAYSHLDENVKGSHFVYENRNYSSYNVPTICLNQQKGKQHNKRSNFKIKNVIFANVFCLFAALSKDKKDSKDNNNVNFGKNEYNLLLKNISTFNNLQERDDVNLKNKKNKGKDNYAYYQELSEYSNIQLFSSNSNHELANEISSNLGIGLGRAYVGKYSDGEIAIQIMDEVRGRDIYIIHTTPAGGKDVHARLMELFLFISTLKRSSAKKVIAVIPYLNYSRQTKQLDDFNYVHSLGAPEIAILLQACGVDSIISVDLHNPRIEGFSTDQKLNQPPLMNINPQSLAVEYFKKKQLENPIIISIDNDGAERTKEFWSRMNKHSFNAGITTIVSSSFNEISSREGYPDSDNITNANETNYKNDEQYTNNIISIYDNENLFHQNEAQNNNCPLSNLENENLENENLEIENLENEKTNSYE
uniref:ribose-phosphate diphosphokinase n=1 Tax=Piliocolobus tephrosceles TaxID=591936 RepID=A0A8C9GQG1_9PRIM